MRLLRLKRASHTTPLNAHSAERDLTEIALRSCGCATRQKVLAIATICMTRGCPIIYMPSTIWIGIRVRNRMRASPAEWIVRRTMCTGSSKLSTLVEIRFRGCFSGCWYLGTKLQFWKMYSTGLLDLRVAMYRRCKPHRLGCALFLVFAWRGRYEQEGLSQFEEGEMVSPMWLHHGKLDSCFHHSVQVNLIKISSKWCSWSYLHESTEHSN